MKIDKYLTISRRILIFWTLFIGVGALAGSLAMFIEPSGVKFKFDALIPYMKKLPIIPDSWFDNFIFPGIMLISINGITNLLAAVFLFAKRKIGYVLGTVFGFTLMLWIIVQFCIFPANFLSSIYFCFGLLQFITGLCAIIYNQRSEFHFDKADYKYIGKDTKTAFVYFSRNGYTAKIAYGMGDKIGASVYEITSPERTKATLGFWWCGRFGMHKWGMPINKMPEELFNAKKIVIVSPIWVFKMSATVRQFINEYSEKLINRKIEFVFNHFNPSLPKGAIQELDSKLKVEKIYSYQTNWGIIKQQKTIR